MNLERFKNKKVVVFGLGVEGFSTAKYLAENGAGFSVAEKKELEELPYDVQEFIRTRNTSLMSGENHADNLKDFDVIIRNPGIPLWNPKLQEAIKNGSEVTSQTKLFFDLCPCPIVGVTGTKGKGTTATLIYEMLKASGKDAYLGGNIGRPPLDFIKNLTKDCVVVLELSSFQLEDLRESPHAAVVLMVTQEHLDSNAPDSPNYHRSIEEYVEAKKNIVRFQGKSDFAVVNYDFERSRDFAKNLPSKVSYFSVKKEVENGAFLSGNELVLKINGDQKILCKKEDIFLRGEHNIQNVLAAVIASVIFGADLSKVREVIETFKGLEHRLEFVREVNGVRYFNDSFSTTPETAIAAIKSFDEPKVLILGGSEKGSDYTELGHAIAKANNIRAVLLIGTTAPQIEKAIYQGQKGIIPETGIIPVAGIIPINLSLNVNMEEVIRRAKEVAQPGDAVLLSPACASFDMFKNYKDRGTQFKREVMNL